MEWVPTRYLIFSNTQSECSSMVPIHDKNWTAMVFSIPLERSRKCLFFGLNLFSIKKVSKMVVGVSQLSQLDAGDESEECVAHDHNHATQQVREI
jgi:hypothetical protein